MTRSRFSRKWSLLDKFLKIIYTAFHENRRNWSEARWTDVVYTYGALYFTSKRMPFKKLGVTSIDNIQYAESRLRKSVHSVTATSYTAFLTLWRCKHVCKSEQTDTSSGLTQRHIMIIWTPCSFIVLSAMKESMIETGHTWHKPCIKFCSKLAQRTRVKLHKWGLRIRGSGS
jgi:hypothetical protein